MDGRYQKTFAGHIENVASKACKKLNCMLQLKVKLDRKYLEVMYVLSVQSSMLYAAVVLAGSFHSDI